MGRQRRPSGGLYLESTKAEQLGVLPGEDRLVRDVMNRHVVKIPPSAPLQNAIETMRQQQVSSLVVADQAGLHGLLMERDIARQAARRNDHLPITVTVAETLGRHKAVSCREDDILADALKLMKERRVPVLTVLNEQGVVTGLLSLLDVAASVMPDTAAAWLNEARK